MKRFSYFVIMLLLLSVALLFYFKQPNGQAYLNPAMIKQTAKQQFDTLSNKTQQLLSKAKDTAQHSVAQLQPAAEPAPATVVYKWQDEQGQWHYGDQPSSVFPSERVTLDDSNITLLPALSQQEIAAIYSTEKHAAKPPQQNSSEPSVYNPQSVQQLYQDAENVKQLLEQRNKQLEQSH